MTMSVADTLILIQKAITRYILPTIVVFGNLGHFISIGILSQKQRRTNSCSIYLLAASIFGLIITNCAIIPLIYALDHIDPLGISLALCRIRGYIIHTSSMSFRYIIVFACADRYAMCNSRLFIRNFSKPRIAYYSISVLTIIWSVISIHLLLFESIENNRCGVYGLYGRIFSIYSLTFFGTIPTCLMIIFGFLLMMKLQQLRRRVQPVRGTFQIKRTDANLGKVVLAEVILSIICTFTYPLMTFYITFTNDTVPNKSADRLKIEAFINFITMSLLLYLNYSTTFFVYFFTSKSFRQSIKQLIIKCYVKFKCMTRNTEQSENA